MKTWTCAVLGMGWLMTAAQAAENVELPASVQLHGYVNAIDVPSSLSPSVGGQIGLTGSILEGELNLTWLLSRRTRLTAQASMVRPKDVDEQDASLDIFSITHLLAAGARHQISMGVGRLRNTLIGFNSGQDHPLEQPGVTRPLVYLGRFSEIFLGVDGVSLSGDRWNEAGDTWHWAVYRGTRNVSVSSASAVNPNSAAALDSYDMTGGKLTWTSGQWPSLTLGGSLLHFDMRYHPTRPAVRYFGQRRDLGILMVRYEGDTWAITAEGARILSRFEVMGHGGVQHRNTDKINAYVQGMWRPSAPWTFWLRYGYAAYSQGLFAPTGSASEGQGITLSLRYRMASHWFAGLQLAHLRLPDLASSAGGGNTAVMRTVDLAMFQMVTYF